MSVFQLTTIDMVKDVLEFWDKRRDSRLYTLINVVSKEMADELNRTLLTASDIIQYFDVEVAGKKFYLKAYPATAVTYVWNSSTRTFDDSTLLDSDNYDVNLTDGVITIDQISLSTGTSAIKVQYDGGLAATTAELVEDYPDLANACAEEVAYRFQQKGSEGVASESGQGGARTYHTKRDKFIPAVQKVVEAYQRVTICQ